MASKKERQWHSYLVRQTTSRKKKIGLVFIFGKGHVYGKHFLSKKQNPQKFNLSEDFAFGRGILPCRVRPTMDWLMKEGKTVSRTRKMI